MALASDILITTTGILITVMDIPITAMGILLAAMDILTIRIMVADQTTPVMTAAKAIQATTLHAEGVQAQ